MAKGTVPWKPKDMLTISTGLVNRVSAISINNFPLSLWGHSHHRLIQPQEVDQAPFSTITVRPTCILHFCRPQSCKVHLEGRVAETRVNLEGETPSSPKGSRPSKLQAEAQWACLSKGFPGNAPEMLWKSQSQNTLEWRKGHSRQWSIVYYASGSKGNQFPTRTLMFLRGPVLYPPLHDWLHVSNLFVVYGWVLQQVGARKINN